MVNNWCNFEVLSNNSFVDNVCIIIIFARIIHVDSILFIKTIYFIVVIKHLINAAKVH